MKKILLIIMIGLALVAAGSVAVHPSVAQAEGGGVGIPEYYRPINLPTANRGEGKDVPQDYAATGVQLILGKIISTILMLSGVITVWFIANNGWWMVVAAGKGEMIDEKKKALFWQITGLVLIILSYVIIQFAVKFATDIFQENPAPTSFLEQTQNRS